MKDQVGALTGPQIFGLLLAPSLIVLAFILPEAEGLTRNGMLSTAILLAALILLLSDSIPYALAALFGLAMLLVLGISTPGQAFFGFSNHIIYFILMSSVISHALVVSNLSKRMLCAILRKFGTSVEAAIVGIMICTGILSAITTNVATVLIFLPLALDFLAVYDNEEDRKRTGRALMIALPIATGLGCAATPAGSALHLVMLGQLEMLTGLTVPFFNWMVIGVPWVIFTLPIGILAVIKLNKPAPLSREKLDAFIKQLSDSNSKKMSFKEKYVLVVVLVILGLWILSTWLPRFHITAVAIFGTILLIVPGFDGLKWKEIEPTLPWTIVFMIGSFISMTHAFIFTGAAGWVTGHIIPATIYVSVITISLFVALIVFIMLVLIPQQTALIPVMSIPVIALAVAAGVSPVALMMVMAFTLSTTYVLPYSSVPLLTYIKGYYTKGDLARTSIPIQLWVGIITALWVPFMVRTLGM